MVKTYWAIGIPGDALNTERQRGVCGWQLGIVAASGVTG
jgi:hypothetical protein